MEVDLAEMNRVVRNQGALLQHRSEVAGLRVGDDGPFVPGRRETIADELVEPELLRAADLDYGVGWRPLADLADRGGDIIRGDRLKQHMRQPNDVTVRRFVRDPLHELEELRGADDRVWDRRGLDQILQSII